MVHSRPVRVTESPRASVRCPADMRHSHAALQALTTLPANGDRAVGQSVVDCSTRSPPALSASAKTYLIE